MLISADTGSLNKKSFQARSGIGFWSALESERDDILWYMPQFEIQAEDPCLSMEMQDLDIVIVSKQEFPRKSEHYDYDA